MPSKNHRKETYFPIIDCFLNLNSIVNTRRLLLPKLISIEKERLIKISKTEKFIKKNKSSVKDGTISSEKLDKMVISLRKLREERTRLMRSVETFINGSFINTLSVYDACILEILREIYHKSPNLLSAKNTLSFADLSECGITSVKQVKDRFIEEEIETFRKNRKNQIAKLEELAGIKIISKLKSKINDFVEGSEVRNIIVHHQGRVTNLFLNNLKEEKIIFPKKAGEVISLGQGDIKKYYISILLVLAETGKALYEKDGKGKEFMDQLLGKVIIDQLKGGQTYEPLCLLDFLKKYDFPEDTYLINKALIYRNAENKELFNKTLEELESKENSKIIDVAVCSLREKFDEASKIIKTITDPKEFLIVKDMVFDPTNSLVFDAYVQSKAATKAFTQAKKTMAIESTVSI
jgi:hypothetical protein